MKYPYQHKMPIKEYISFVNEMQDLIEEEKKRFNITEDILLPFFLIEKKPIAYGIRFEFCFLFSHNAISEMEWNDLNKRVKTLLENQFGNKGTYYIKPYDIQKKFDFRYEIYISFEEYDELKGKK